MPHLRIVHILHSHGYGGAENHAVLMMKGQQAAGHELMFAGPLDSWIGSACADAGIKALHIGMHGLFDLISHWKLRQLMLDWQPDIVHGHAIRGAMYAGQAGKQGRRPLAICTAHSTDARTHMRGCEHIIAVSGAVRDNLISAQYRSDRITVIHNGVPSLAFQHTPEQRAQLRQELGIPNGVTAVVNPGRFSHEKGQDLLLQAMAHVPSDVNLYLMGDASTAFGQQVSRMPHDPQRVHFMGYRDDVQQILPAFDMLALPSRREAISLAVIEAFSASLPVVAAAVGGVPEIVLPEHTGLLVPPEDPLALAQAITRMHSQTAWAQQLGKQARQHYEQHLTTECMVSQTLALYERCLSR